MQCTPLEHPTAKKPHRCDSCGEVITVGTGYVRWRCYMDGDASTNKMHQECYDMHDADGGQWEYTPYSYERPAVTPNVQIEAPSRPLAKVASNAGLGLVPGKD